MYAGDWARAGVRVSLTKTGNDNSCSRYVTLEMVDEDRFARNPYAESLAVIVNVSDSHLSLCFGLLLAMHLCHGEAPC
jgi:hypothetical protein